MSSKEIQSLLTERAGYVARGLKDRIASVDDALRVAGYVKEVASVLPPAETASAPKVVRKRVAGNGDN